MAPTPSASSSATSTVFAPRPPRRGLKPDGKNSNRPIASSAVCRSTSPTSTSSSFDVTETKRPAPEKTLEVITFDLDDTLWPTTPVVNAANEALIEWCASRLGARFPRTPTVHATMKRIREQRECEAVARGVTAEPMSYAAIRIAGATRAAIEAGIPESDAVATVARGYHLAWIPMRNAMARELVFPGVREALREIRERHPGAVVGSITNGFGSAEGAGLGEFFDFEISAEALIDEHMVHGEMARKPHPYPFQLAMGIAIADYGFSGDSDAWVHVGDDVLNDCYAAKQFDFKTVYVSDPSVTPYQSGGGAPHVETKLRGVAESARADVVDASIETVRALPGLLAGWYDVAR